MLYYVKDILILDNKNRKNYKLHFKKTVLKIT